MSTKFIFVDKAAGTLYISPEISDNQHDYTNPEDATVPFSHPQQGLASGNIQDAGYLSERHADPW